MRRQRSHVAMTATTVVTLAIGTLLFACARSRGGDNTPAPDPSPRTARTDLVDELHKDMEAERHPADGGGHARLETGDKFVTASTPGRWTFTYEAGPLGIVDGGFLFLQVPPFWGWTTPQTTDAAAPGFTDVSTAAEGVILVPQTLGPQLLGIQVTGRKLEAGQRIRIVYGAGASGAIADRYAEKKSPFWFAVDGDGDGVRALVPDPPSIEIRPGPPARLRVVLPSTARPDDTVRLTVAILDAAGNAGCPVDGDVRFVDPPSGLDLPERITLHGADGGHKTTPVTVHAPGTYRIRVTGPGGLSGESNPLLVSSTGPRILWGDLHGHSNFSDGTGTPAEYFRYARDVAALDVAALSDHDHWGMQFIDSHPEMWKEIRRQVTLFNAPGRFVTLLAYEWTSWIHGHRHVLYFSDDGPLHSSLAPDTTTPQQLWNVLRGQDVITIAHHSAGGPIATNWSYAPDPILEPVTEVVSVHGSSEAMDSPGRIYHPVFGNFVRDALARGYRLGFVGSGDSHDGHPGNAHLAAASGGLAAILSEELTRPGIRDALRARRVYATNGPRILLRVGLGDTRMGGTMTVGSDEVQAKLAVRVLGTAVVERIDVVSAGAVVESVPGNGSMDMAVTRMLGRIASGGYVYVRVVQVDGGLAWSSPIFVQ